LEEATHHQGRLLRLAAVQMDLSQTMITCLARHPKELAQAAHGICTLVR